MMRRDGAGAWHTGAVVAKLEFELHLNETRSSQCTIDWEVSCSREQTPKSPDHVARDNGQQQRSRSLGSLVHFPSTTNRDSYIIQGWVGPAKRMVNKNRLDVEGSYDRLGISIYA
jgi:hypothetical protein